MIAGATSATSAVTVPGARSVQAQVGPRFTPAELSDLLGLRYRPTAEQTRVVAAPVEPLLVVAGAGSGKTETMAARVVWLVANDYVRPDQILGLTFTRKAAGELAHRVRQRLSQLVRKLGQDDRNGGEPTIATYHSYAARVVTEHGLRAGYEPSTRLLTGASCWQLADAVVRGYEGDMSKVAVAPSTVTGAVLQLAAELAEHLIEPAQLAAWTGRFYAGVTTKPGKVPAAVRRVLENQQARLQLLPLVRLYAERKQRLEAMDYGDQMSRAALVATGHPEVGAIERDRYRVVLLDEYQDTSHAQVVLLRALFGNGHPVTAVGDPCQSIYGWRGASAGALDRFPAEFRRRGGEPAHQESLSASWRNRPEILRVANALSAPLRAYGHHVAELTPAAAYPVGSGTAVQPAGTAVRCALLDTYLDEADWIADRVLTAWCAAAQVPPGTDPVAIAPQARPSTAVLVRTRTQIPAIEVALRSRGLPVEVVGLGGLLDTPEVRDVVSTLRVLADPTEGAALLRLLTGPRWRIGPRDIVALHRRARELVADREPAEAPGSAPRLDRLGEPVIVEAMDDLGPAEGYSPEGYARLAALGEELRGLRARFDQPLPDLVADVEHTIGLDVEVAVRRGDAGMARSHLDALGDIAARFAAEAEGPTLPAFLAFLAAAESEERGLSPGEVEVAEGAVQILTVHAAKGLEWDIVAVAGLSRNVFPGPTTMADHWLGALGMLPFPLRGDRAGLPVLRAAAAEDQKGVAAALAGFDDDWRAHDEREERRLGYVAVTRPRWLLLCSGYWWGEGLKKPRGPSPFLAQVRAECLDGAGRVDGWAPEPPDGTVNPTAAELARTVWPADPLGSDRPALTEAADLVERAGAAIADGAVGQEDPVLPDGLTVAERDEARRWAYEVDLLLAERARLAPDPNAPVEVAVPAHMSVSQLVWLRWDAQRLARKLRRPLPVRPSRYARRGTAFHAWLEQRFGGDRLFDLAELPGAADEDAAPDAALGQLQEAFLASDWADRTPVQVEVPFATVVAGVVLRGRIDAVFADGRGGFDVIDWKTGRQPTGAAATAAAVQLAAYRLAWASLAGVPLDQVRAGFHYVPDNVTERPADLLDEAGLTALITDLPVGDG